MVGRRLIDKWRNIFQGQTVVMRRRLRFFLLFFTVAILAGIMLILAVIGVFPSGTTETEKLLSKELQYLSDGLSDRFGSAALQTVRLSQGLTDAIAAMLAEHGLTPQDLAAHPELLEEISSAQLPLLLNVLNITDFNGAFFALDATINPNVPGAEFSKSGIYIRNIEPSISAGGVQTRLLLRGFPDLALRGDLNMQANWDLEFQMDDQPIWDMPLAAHEADPSLPLSRLVYWHQTNDLRPVAENVIFCSVPILDSDGNPFGVCGLGVTQMNYLLRYEPDDSTFHNTVTLLTAINSDGIQLDIGLYSGNSTVYSDLQRCSVMQIGSFDDGLFKYTVPGWRSFVGMHRDIRLYPYDSPFADDHYAMAVLIPKEDFDSEQTRAALLYVLVFAAVLAVGIVGALALTHRYFKPIADNLDQADLQSEDGMVPITNIQEIDALLERLFAMQGQGRLAPGQLFEEFVGRVGTLTNAEMSVFRCHARRMSIEEISKTLFMAQGTVRNHDTRIFKKLNVSSKDELELYTQLLDKCGLLDDLLCDDPENPQGE